MTRPCRRGSGVGMSGDGFALCHAPGTVARYRRINRQHSAARSIMADEKQVALANALAQIERQHGKGSIMKMGEIQEKMAFDVISTGSIALDLALGVGGLPRGRIVEVYGPESSGKTTLALRQHLDDASARGIGECGERLHERYYMGVA